MKEREHELQAEIGTVTAIAPELAQSETLVSPTLDELTRRLATSKVLVFVKGELPSGVDMTRLVEAVDGDGWMIFPTISFDEVKPLRT